MIEVPALIPELDVSSLERSLRIYRDVFGFAVLFERPEEMFAYLTLGSAHLMLQQVAGPGRRFRTAELEKPYGRGVNFQLAVPDVVASRDRASAAELQIILPLEDRWYRQGSFERGNRQFVVADADGYLFRFHEDLGIRHVSPIGGGEYGSAEARRTRQNNLLPCLTM